MHELSIVEALLESVQQELRARPEARLGAVQLRVGALRLIEPETLQFCFAAAVRDTPLDGARLEIERVEAAARCTSCQTEFAVEEQWFECPACHSLEARLLRGEELDLTGLELNEVVLEA